MEKELELRITLMNIQNHNSISHSSREKYVSKLINKQEIEMNI